jgi:hypothetical protein
MKYSVIQCVNGNFSIVSEHSDVDKGIVKFHDVCKNLWNASDVVTARVNLVDENYFVVEGRYTEFIDRTPEPEPNEA